MFFDSFITYRRRRKRALEKDQENYVNGIHAAAQVDFVAGGM